MLRIYAPNYIRIGQMIEQYHLASMLNSPNAVPNQEQLESFIGTLQSLKGLCEQIRLPVSTRTLERTIAEFRQNVPRQSQGQQRMDEWFSCFTSELESRLFMFVLPHRVGYWHAEAGDGGPFYGEEINALLGILHSNFRDAFYDASEAGQCFAYGRFTACVYHLMRVAEYGLVSVAHSAGVVGEQLERGWDHCIIGINSKIREWESLKTPGWQENKKKYSDLSAWFLSIRNGWRNPVSHVPRNYSEDSARGIFSAVTTLFQHLQAGGFSQAKMPDESMRLPADNSEVI